MDHGRGPMWNLVVYELRGVKRSQEESRGVFRNQEESTRVKRSQSFCHNLNYTFNQKTSLTKFVRFDIFMDNII